MNLPDQFDPDGPSLAEQVSKAAEAEFARRELCKRDFLAFCARFWPIAGLGKIFKAGWVHRDIAIRLTRFIEQVELELRPRLMLLMPPRHGKSTVVSIMFYCWVLGKHPEWSMFNVGYNEDLPLEFSKAIREVLGSREYQEIFPKTKIKRDDRAADHWKTTQGGGMRAAGLAGGITGHGAHIMGIDDPLKGDEAAESQGIRDKLYDGYQSNIRTRLAPGGGILLIQTWWNDDDLAGRLIQLNEDDGPMAKYRDKFDVVLYPATTEEGDWEYRDEETLEIIRFHDTPEEPFTEDELDDLNYIKLRGPLEALHPARYTFDELMAIRADVSDKVWSALYQQNPIPASGTFFKDTMIHLVKELPLPDGGQVCTGWDFAIGEKKANNFTCGATVQQHWSGTMFLRRIRKFKGNAYMIGEAMLTEAKYYLGLPDPPHYTIAVEKGQIWDTAKPTIKAIFEREKIPWTIVVEYVATTDKMARATPLQDLMERRMFKILAGARWLADFLREFMKFPNTKDKDQVDATTWAVRHLLSLGAPAIPEGEEITAKDGWAEKKYKSWRDRLSGNRNGNSHMSA